MDRSDIRVKALALVRRQHNGVAQILLHEVYDKDSKGTPTPKVIGYRTLGGHVEFGERAADTLKREIKEELNADITIVKLAGISENIFTWGGKAGHEVIFVYEAVFVDKTFYERDTMLAVNDEGGTFNVLWLDPYNIPNGLRLFPDGLLEILSM